MKQHSPQFLNLVNQAKQNIHELSAEALKTMIDSDDELYLIDVREDHEWTTGHIPTAIHIGKGIIERDIEKTIPDSQAKIVVYCSGGFRCALVADTLQKMGYSDVHSLDKGSQGWVDAGYKLTQS
ncbi:rhodanese-like domain-containing protein [Legionella sp. km772]|uniref:rhodanese-like domain-containing protein n=1 Tax=Legionella sp. km772 TaxID=2498111 RepID=UPI000F8D4EA2|nr:rhodanese-like domain-containing protein [Legionella sp. km772]RUR13072.1 sulfurtransferase [Legionella sp. km772]